LIDQVWSHVRIIHPYPAALVTAVSVGLVLFVHGSSPGGGTLVRAGMVVLCSQISVGALNDYVDRQEDARAHRDKPIAIGQVSPTFALVLAGAGLLLFLPLSLSFGWESLVVTTIGLVAALAYDFWLKRTSWSFISYLISFTALVAWIWLIAGHLTANVALLTLPAGLLLTSVHLAQSYPDVEADKRAGLHGLAVALGVAGTSRWTILLYLLGVCCSLGLAILARSELAFVLAVAGVGVGAYMWSMREKAYKTREARLLLFRVEAAGVALAALSCVLSVRVLGG
jgi:heme o synthase